MYAPNTQVSVERSQAELRRMIVDGHGATHYLVGEKPDEWVVQFLVRGRLFRLQLPRPKRGDRGVERSGTRQRTEREIEQELQKRARQHWRVLLLAIRGKLEAVAAGITTLELEFLAQVVLPDNGSVGDWLRPQLKAMYESGKVPSLSLTGESR